MRIWFYIVFTLLVLRISSVDESILKFVSDISNEHSNQHQQSQPFIWSLTEMLKSGESQTKVLGNPTIETVKAVTAIRFNGIDDGIIVEKNPLHGYQKFTIEVLFNPSSGGNEEQRFLHFEDESLNRGLIEIRVNPDQTWSLDTFLYDTLNNSRLTLLDRSIKHPLDQWYWVALSYDGESMSHFVNANLELSGNVDFGATENGSISIGVRLNKVHWFKGLISEIRFHDSNLSSVELQSTKK